MGNNDKTNVAIFLHTLYTTFVFTWFNKNIFSENLNIESK